MARLLRGVLFVLPFVFFTACGGGGGQDINLVVGQLGNTGITSGASSAHGAMRFAVDAQSPSDATPSNTDFSYAVVDGIKVKLNSIQFNTESNSGGDSTSLGDQEVELGSGVTNVNLNTTLSISPGTYSSAAIIFDNSFKVKAFCRTNDKLVYTASDDTVKTISCSNSESNPDSNCALPSDYGYKSYSFMNTTTAEGASDTDDTVQEETRDSITITEGESSNIMVLIDTTALVTCYDGDGSGGVDTQTGVLNPFNWNPRNGSLSDYFPNGTANFGIGYLPTFTWVGSDSATPPTAETYLLSDNASELTASPIDFSEVVVVTFAFEENGDIFAARGRNFGTGVDLDQMYMDFVSLGSDTYQIDNGEWYTGRVSDPSDNGGPYADRRITNFKRLSLSDSPNATTVTDGPMCGDTDIYYETPGTQRAKSCLSSDLTVYWKRLQRDDE